MAPGRTSPCTQRPPPVTSPPKFNFQSASASVKKKWKKKWRLSLLATLQSKMRLRFEVTAPEKKVAQVSHNLPCKKFMLCTLELFLFFLRKPFSFEFLPYLSSPFLSFCQGIWSCIHGVHIDMKKKNPELDFSPQANMLHLLKSAKSMALSSPKRNTVLLQPSLLDVMAAKGTIALLHTL